MLSYRGSIRRGRLIGAVAWNVCGGLRRQARRNLDLAYGKTLQPGENERIARGAFDVLGRNITDVANLAGRPYRGLEVENVDLLRSPYDQGEGVGLVSAHMGCIS